MVRFVPAAVLVALGPLLGGCPADNQYLDAAIQLGAAGYCATEISSPPVNPGPITKSTYAAVLTSCKSLPTNEATAEQFIAPIIQAYLQAKLAGN